MDDGGLVNMQSSDYLELSAGSQWAPPRCAPVCCRDPPAGCLLSDATRLLPVSSSLHSWIEKQSGLGITKSSVAPLSLTNI